MKGPVLAGLLLVLAAGTGLHGQSWTTFYSAYQDGLEAQQQGDPRLAEKAFRKAALQAPAPGVRVKTYGMNFLPCYYPYLKLAEAALAAGDLAQAETALKDSARWGLEPGAQREALWARLRAAQAPAAQALAAQTPAAQAPAAQTPAAQALAAQAPAAQALAAQAPALQAASAPVAHQAVAPVVPTPTPRVQVPSQGAASPGGPASPAAGTPAAVPAGGGSLQASVRLPPVPGPQGKGGAPPSAPPPAPSSGGPSMAPALAPPPLAASARPFIPWAAATLPSAVPGSGAHRSWPGWLGLGGLAALLGGGWALRRRRAPRVVAARTTAIPATGGSHGFAPAQGPGTDTNLERAFGPWVAKQVLGTGGCGTAYLGVHASSGERVAIKVPHRHLMQNPDFLARFRREAAFGALLDHPRIVRILDPGPPEGEPWLVMPFIEGLTLEAYLQERGPLEIPVAIHLGSDVAEAISHAHAKGVVHRDLKPANIMVGELGAVVMDLGIARILDSGKHTSVYLGTPTYSAPETMQNPSVGPPADRYALGVMLFEMLAGHPPFQGENAFKILEAHSFEPLPDLGALRPLVPPRLLRLIQRLCEKKPEDRPEDGEMVQILRDLKFESPL